MDNKMDIPLITEQHDISRDSYDKSIKYPTEQFERIDSSSDGQSQLLADNALIQITLDDVKVYEHNTRTSPNALYDEIKQSIRMRGLDNAPTITKRPDDNQYMIMNGGNTRLQILQELYQETLLKIQKSKQDGNKKLTQKFQLEAEGYYRHKWLYKQFVSELDCFSGHIIENEQRADTLFIDKALSVSKYREFFNNQAIDVKSNRAIAEQITLHGWSISHASIGIMLFAIDELYPFIPNLLHSGLSAGKTNELRKLHHTYLKYISKINNGDDIKISSDTFQSIWESALVDCDTINIKDFNLSNIRSDLDKAIELRSGVGLFSITSNIDEISVIPEGDFHENTAQPDKSDISKPIDVPESSLVIQKSDPVSEPTSKDSKATDQRIWSIVHTTAVKLAQNYQLEHIISDKDDFPGFTIRSDDSISLTDDSDANTRKVATWFWLSMLGSDNPEQVLSGSAITVDQVLPLSVFLTKTRIQDKKFGRSFKNVENSLDTVIKLSKVS